MTAFSPLQNDFNLAHFAPGLESLQGAYVSNIERLERHAERTSTKSDIGAEIRRIGEGGKCKVGSRRSSLSPSLSSKQQYASKARLELGRQKGAAGSIYVAQSVGNIDGAARVGEYPPESVTRFSASDLQSKPSARRSRRSVNAAGPIRIVAMDQEEKALGSPYNPLLSAPWAESRLAEKSLFQPDLHWSPSASNSGGSTSSRTALQDFRIHDGDLASVNAQSAVQRCNSQAESVTTPDAVLSRSARKAPSIMAKARPLFRDFDGVHLLGTSFSEQDVVNIAANEQVQGNDHGVNMSFDVSVEEEQQQTPAAASQQSRISQYSQVPRQSQILRRSQIWPRGEIQVYYPAPIPQILNLPPRLSQRPAGQSNTKRTSRFFGSLPAEVRKSQIWQDDDNLQRSAPREVSPKEEKSNQCQSQSQENVQGLPPQLQVGVFLKHIPVSQEVAVMHGSATATLEKLLDAAAQAPVALSPAATSRRLPIPAGIAGSGKRSSTMSLLPNLVEPRKSRMSLLALKRYSTNNILKTSKESRINIHESPTETSRTDKEPAISATQRAPAIPYSEGESHEYVEPSEAAKWMESMRSDKEPENVASPSHLAVSSAANSHSTFQRPKSPVEEIRRRKTYKLARNRNSTTCTGMHATLLETDAVAQVEEQRRKGQRPTLALKVPQQQTWSHADGRAVTDGDDEAYAPFGKLYSVMPAHGERTHAVYSSIPRDLKSNDLVAQRYLEDNEPLSQRRNRLKSLPPRQQRAKEGSSDCEPLAPSTLRLQASKAPTIRPVGEEFVAEMMSELGLRDFPAKEPDEAAAQAKGEEKENAEEVEEAEEEQETLAQWRKRLLVSAQAQSQAGATTFQPVHTFANPSAARPTSPFAYQALGHGLLTQDELEARRRSMLSYNPGNPFAGSYDSCRSGMLYGNTLQVQGRSDMQENKGFMGGFNNDAAGGMAGLTGEAELRVAQYRKAKSKAMEMNLKGDPDVVLEVQSVGLDMPQGQRERVESWRRSIGL